MLGYRKKSAVFTICRNESVFLPLWIDYYRGYFKDKDIYVLDHQSTDKSTDDMPNRVIVENDLTEDNNWLIEVTCDFQKKLLEKYESVLFVNVDEIVVPDPEVYNGIQDYIEKNKHRNMVRCLGFEVLHMLKDEPDYDVNKKVLEQRKFWYNNPKVYNKPLLSQVPIEWACGWHNAKNANPSVDKNLFLIHLHRMDYSYCLSRHKKTAAEPVYRPDLDDKKWGWHFRIHEDEEFAKWFYCVKAAKILDAPKSLSVFEQDKMNSFDTVYNLASEMVSEIPLKLQESV